MSRLLFAVMTCHANPNHEIELPERTRVDHTLRLPAIRETWAKGRDDVKFFFGRGKRNVREDEVLLDCGDSYYETAYKVREICRWALEHGYDSIFKADDDCYVRPERVIDAGWTRRDFVCRVLPPTDINHPVPYPYGGCGYYLSRRMVEIAANDTGCVSKPTGTEQDRCNTYEDGWIGRVALDAKVELFDDHRLKALRQSSGDFEGYPWRVEAPSKYNCMISVCEFPNEMMYEVDQHWRDSWIGEKSPSS